MLIVSIVLLIGGAALLVAEATMPGFGVFGISGLVTLAVSAYFALFYTPYGAVLVCCELVVLAAGVYLFVRKVKRGQFGKKLFLNETLNEYTPKSVNLDEYIGKTGAAKTSMRPAGVVLIGEVSFDAVSDGRYIAEDTKITAIRIENGRLVVAPANV